MTETAHCDAQIRPERAGDEADISRIVRDAFTAEFGHCNEAELVNQLRREADPCISLVATIDDVLVGYVMFSPVTVDGGGDSSSWSAMALAPLAVTPSHQRSGIGALLVQKGLEACLAIQQDVVFVLGHPRYYPRFGFRPTAPLGIRSEYKDVSDASFMVAELTPYALAGRSGTVRFHSAFSMVA